MGVSQEIVQILKEEDLDFVASLPCSLLDELIERVSEDDFFTHLPVTREEEGVGICAGVALGGRIPVLVIQNSGLGNSINALASLTLLYELPLVLLVSHRGTEGEKIGAQLPMGEATTRLLDSIGIEYEVLEAESDVEDIGKLVRKARKGNRPVAALLPFSFWGVNQ